MPVIDRSTCRIFTKSPDKCGAACVRACAAKAIIHKQEDEIITDKFGAIVVASGYSLYPWEKHYGEYGGGRYQDVITGLHLERMLQASGPTGGHVIRPSDGKEPKNVVFIQCVGSWDESKGVPYCSGICCMYTAKMAGADAIAVACPLCHANLDMRQAAEQRNHQEYGVPIIYISQLIGLAEGKDRRSLGLDKHIVSVEKALAKIQVLPEQKAAIP